MWYSEGGDVTPPPGAVRWMGRPRNSRIGGPPERYTGRGGKVWEAHGEGGQGIGGTRGGGARYWRRTGKGRRGVWMGCETLEVR